MYWYQQAVCKLPIRFITRWVLCDFFVSNTNDTLENLCRVGYCLNNTFPWVQINPLLIQNCFQTLDLRSQLRLTASILIYHFLQHWLPLSANHGYPTLEILRTTLGLQLKSITLNLEVSSCLFSPSRHECYFFLKKLRVSDLGLVKVAKQGYNVFLQDGHMYASVN